MKINFPWKFQTNLTVHAALTLCAVSALLCTQPAIFAHAQTPSYAQQLDDWQTKVRRFERKLKEICDDLDEDKLRMDKFKFKKDDFDQLWESAVQNNDKIDKEVEQVYAASARIGDNLDTTLDAGSIDQQNYDNQMGGLARATNRLVSRLLEKRQLDEIYERNFYAYAHKYNYYKSMYTKRKKLKDADKDRLTEIRNNPPINPILIVGRPAPNPKAPTFPDKRLDDFQIKIAVLGYFWKVGSPDYLDWPTLDADTLHMEDIGKDIDEFLGFKERCIGAFTSLTDFRKSPSSCLEFYGDGASTYLVLDEPVSGNDISETRTETNVQQAREDILRQAQEQQDNARIDQGAINAEADALLLLDTLQRALYEAEQSLSAKGNIRVGNPPKVKIKPDIETTSSSSTRDDSQSIPEH